MNDLRWGWITLAAIAPPLLAIICAWPLWRSRQMTFGSIIGTTVIFGSAVALILREYVELDRLTQECLDAGAVCFPTPSAFTRFAIYAFIALAQVFALFWFALFVEERVRRRDYSREWQH